MPAIEYNAIKTNIAGNQKFARIFHKLGRKVLEVTACFSWQLDGGRLLSQSVLVWDGPARKHAVTITNLSDENLQALSTKVDVVAALKEVTEKAQFTKEELESLRF